MKLRIIFIFVCLAPALMGQKLETAQVSGLSRFPEAEFVASSSFRSASYVQPLWRSLRFEGDYFGGDENDVGYTGVSWELRWKKLRLAPGFGLSFGGNGFNTMPGISLRWAYEKSWFISEGLIVQGLLDTQRIPESTPDARAEATVRPTITDGDHVSAHWRRLTIGGTWERIQFREIEWKGGGRVAIRIVPHLSAVVYILGPGAEVRAGFMFHPDEEK